MDRVAVFVDAGYFFAAGSGAVSGRKCSRGEIVLDHECALQELRDFAESTAGVPLLRIYWYDGTSAGPTSQQLTLAYSLDVKIRLGFVNAHGQQKGVDSLIVTDMITLARNRGMSDAVVLSGDEDVRVGVQQAQEFGVRVHLLGIATAHQNQSSFLRQEADTVRVWTAEDIGRFLSISEPAETPITKMAPVTVAIADAPDELLERVVASVIGKIPTETIRAVVTLASPGNIPRDIDRMLLGTARAESGGMLEHERVRALRSLFYRECQTALSPLPVKSCARRL